MKSMKLYVVRLYGCTEYREHSTRSPFFLLSFVFFLFFEKIFFSNIVTLLITLTLQTINSTPWTCLFLIVLLALLAHSFINLKVRIHIPETAVDFRCLTQYWKMIPIYGRIMEDLSVWSLPFITCVAQLGYHSEKDIVIQRPVTLSGRCAVPPPYQNRGECAVETVGFNKGRGKLTWIRITGSTALLALSVTTVSTPFHRYARCLTVTSNLTISTE